MARNITYQTQNGGKMTTLMQVPDETGVLVDLGDAIIAAKAAALASSVSSSSAIRVTSHFVENPNACPLVLDGANGGGVAANQQNNDVGHIGSLKLQTNSGSTGLASALLQQSQTLLGYGAGYIEEVFQIPTLSNGTDSFELRVGGMSDNASKHGANSKDAFFLSYDHAVNGGRWLLRAVANDVVATPVDTGVAAVAGAWVKLRLAWNADASLGTAYINGVQVATITGLPSGLFRNISAGMVLEKYAGSSSAVCILDFFDFFYAFTTPL